MFAMINRRRMGAVVCRKNCRMVVSSSRSVRGYQYQSYLINKWNHNRSDRLGQLVLNDTSHHLNLPNIVSRYITSITTSHTATRRLIPSCNHFLERTNGIFREDEGRRQIHTTQQYRMATGEASGGSGGGGSQGKPILPDKGVPAPASSSPSPPPPPPPPTTLAINPSPTNLNHMAMLPRPPRRPKKVQNFLFQKFFAFVQGYQDMMETKFPDAMKVYRVFILGVKEFAKELGEYVKIKTKAMLSSDGITKLKRDELDVYYRMPAEIFRVAPTLILSALPGFQYIMFPIAYKFPKRLLSTHFWSLQQKAQFAIEGQQKRLQNQRPVFRQLQNRVEDVRDSKLREVCREILFKLGSGTQPSVREIMRIKPLFESDAYSLKAMHGPHVKALCRLHGIHTWFFNRSRLGDRAEMLYVMDVSLIREGIFTLKPDELRNACFLRGLNAANTSHEDMVEFLQQWISVSSTIQKHSYSLLLHLPVLIAYNNPNNWALLS